MTTKRLYVGVIASSFHAYCPFYNVWSVYVKTTMADKLHIRARLKRKEIVPLFLGTNDIPSGVRSFSEIEEDYQWLIDQLHDIFATQPTAVLFVPEENVYRLLYPFLKIQLSDAVLPKPDVRFSSTFLFDYGECDIDGLLYDRLYDLN